MKSLSNYVEESQTKLFNKTGAFFAFSTEQFNKAKKDGVKYVSLGIGLVCPKENAKTLVTEIGDINEKGIKQDMEENGKKDIIWRELANHEAQITSDISDTVDALQDYPITQDEILAEFHSYFDHCVENDYF